MPNIYLYSLEPNPFDIRLRDPTTSGIYANFQGNSNGDSACSADFGGVRMVAGNSAGASAVSASFGGVKSVAGGSVGASSVSGSFGGVKTFAGGSAGASGASGAFNGVRYVSGGSAGSSAASGTFSVSGGAAQVLGSSFGSSVSSATFTVAGPSEPGRGSDATFKPNRWDPSKTPRDAKPDKKDAKPHPVRAKRKILDAKPDFRRAKDYFDIPAPQAPIAPMPVARRVLSVPSVPMGRVQFANPEPGVGRAEMDAVMAVLAALDTNDVNGLKEKLFQTMPEEDLELVLLADEITS